jgi:gas vesicle protein
MKRKFGVTRFKKRVRGKSMKWTFFAGLGVGTALGMLVAPKAGSELRGDIEEFARDSFEEGREKLQPVIDQAWEKVEPVVNEAKRRTEPVLDGVRQRIDSVTTQAASVRDRVVDGAADLKERITNGDLLKILNEWPHERLIAIDGIGPVLATKIIQNRPYHSEQELIESKELPPSAIESLRKAA